MSDAMNGWSQWRTASGDASGRIVATFHDIDAVAALVGDDGRRSAEEAAAILPMGMRGDLLESLVLSPGTGAAAQLALATAGTRMAGHVLLSDGFALVATTVVSTYEVADASLEAAAGAFAFVGGVTVTVAKATAAAVTTLAVAQVTVPLLLEAALDAAVQEGFEAFVEAFGDTWQDILDDPTILGDAGGLLERLAGHTIDNLDVDHFWAYFLNDAQANLGALGPGLDGIIAALGWSAGLLGFSDGGTLSSTSSIDRAELLNRLAGFNGPAAQQFGDAVQFDPDTGDLHPDTITELVLSMGQVDALGGHDQGVIRIIRTDGPPPTFTAVIPSTQEWDPTVGKIPNDVIGNLHVMTGQSGLEEMTRQSLEAAMAQYAAEHHVSIESVRASSPVMLAGFSQGGITAGAFAQNYSSTYDVQQVVTVGAPIGGFDIPSNVSVIAYEADLDPVPRLDGAPNPSTWDTHPGDNGGGMPGSHDDLHYAQMATDDPPSGSNNLDQFLDANSTITDYYATK